MLQDFGKNKHLFAVPGFRASFETRIQEPSKHLFVGRAAFPESFAPDGMRPCPTLARGSSWIQSQF